MVGQHVHGVDLREEVIAVRSPWTVSAVIVVVAAVAGAVGPGWAGLATIAVGSLAWTLFRRSADPQRQPSLRPLVFGLVTHGDQLLVCSELDEAGSEVWRPPGGPIEFGERADAAMKRWAQSILGVEVESKDLSAVGALEIPTTVHGTEARQMALLYTVTLRGPGRYGKEALGQARWRPIRDFVEDRAGLEPDGLAEFLSER